MRFHLPFVACEFNEEFSLTTHFTTDKFFLSIGHQSQIFRVFFSGQMVRNIVRIWVCIPQVILSCLFFFFNFLMSVPEFSIRNNCQSFNFMHRHRSCIRPPRSTGQKGPRNPLLCCCLHLRKKRDRQQLIFCFNKVISIDTLVWIESTISCTISLCTDPKLAYQATRQTR